MVTQSNASDRLFPEEILTPRLRLALVENADAPFVMELVNTPGWIEFIGDRNVHSIADAEAYIQRILGYENFYYFVARLHDEQTPVGIVSYLKRDYLDHFDLGFALLPAFEGLGLAREGALAVIEGVRSHPAHQRILATTLPANHKSKRLLEGLGFKKEREIVEKDDLLEVFLLMLDA